jgi:hypothetical protein
MDLPNEQYYTQETNRYQPWKTRLKNVSLNSIATSQNEQILLDNATLTTLLIQISFEVLTHTTFTFHH